MKKFVLAVVTMGIASFAFANSTANAINADIQARNALEAIQQLANHESCKDPNGFNQCYQSICVNQEHCTGYQCVGCSSYCASHYC